MGRIQFFNYIMKDQVLKPGEQCLHYNINKWIKQVSFDILHYISKNVTLVQLMDTFGIVNCAVSIVGYWIFESNYKFSLPLKIDSFNHI